MFGSLSWNCSASAPLSSLAVSFALPKDWNACMACSSSSAILGMILPWDKPGNVSAREGCVLERALCPASSAGAPEQLWGQNSAVCRARLCDQLLGRCVPMERGFSSLRPVALSCSRD